MLAKSHYPQTLELTQFTHPINAHVSHPPVAVFITKPDAQVPHRMKDRQLAQLGKVHNSHKLELFNKYKASVLHVRHWLRLAHVMQLDRAHC